MDLVGLSIVYAALLLVVVWVARWRALEGAAQQFDSLPGATFFSARQVAEVIRKLK